MNHRIYKHLWYLKNRLKILHKRRNYYKKNKKILDLQNNLWVKNNKLRRLEIMKKYRDSHKTQLKQKDIEYRHKNRIKINYYHKMLAKTNISYKIKQNIRCRINLALKETYKATNTMKLLGCSLDQLKQHLEKQFKPGMTWNNHGRGDDGKGMKEWHVDHIKPCANFDLSKPEEQRRCFNYTNLQPLWAKENMRKGKKI